MQQKNFNEMSLPELRKYVLKNRGDEAAWREYADRPRPNKVTIPADAPKEAIAKLIKSKIKEKD